MRPGKTIILAWLAAVILSGCQTAGGDGGTALDTAGNTAPAAETRKFTAPPRSARDIVEIMKRPVAAGSGNVAADRKTALSKPPASGDMAKFYLNRARAARRLGWFNQELSDLRKARADLVGQPVLSVAYSKSLFERLAWVESRSGSFINAINVMKDAARVDSSNPQLHHNLSRLYTVAGDREMSSKALADAKAQEYSKMIEARDEQNENAFGMGGFGSGSLIPSVRGSVSLRDNSPKARFNRAMSEFVDKELSGKWSEAENDILRAIAIFTDDGLDGDDPLGELTLRIDLSRNLLRQGRIGEAEVEGRRVLKEAVQKAGNPSVYSAMALRNLANIFVYKNQLEDAESIARLAVQSQQAGNPDPASVEIVLSGFFLAEVLALREKWQEALSVFDDIRSTAPDTWRAFEKLFQQSHAFNAALLMGGRLDELLKNLEDTLKRRMAFLPENDLGIFEVKGFQAVALARAGRVDDALRGFDEAAPGLARALSVAATEARHSGFANIWRRMIVDAYLGLLAGDAARQGRMVNGASRLDWGFQLVQAIKSGTVEKALALGATRMAMDDSGLGSLARQADDADQKLSALYQAAAAIVEEETPQSSRTTAAIRARIASLKASQVTIRDEISRRFPRYAELTSPGPLSITGLKGLLNPTEALLFTFIGDKEGYIWAIPALGEAAFSAIDLDRARTREVVYYLRRAVDPGNIGSIRDIP
ncbi:MAG: hypothetical protein V3R66_02430, partial [Rhodospirillales bacterium]